MSSALLSCSGLKLLATVKVFAQLVSNHKTMGNPKNELEYIDSVHDNSTSQSGMIHVQSMT